MEKDYVSNAIALSVEQMRAYVDSSFVSTNNDNCVTGYALNIALHYTKRMENNSARYRVDKVVTRITKTDTATVVVSQADQMYRASLEQGAEKWQTIYYNGALGTQAYTLMSSHSGFYISYNDALTALTYGVGAQASVSFSNGEFLLVQVIAFA